MFAPRQSFTPRSVNILGAWTSVVQQSDRLRKPVAGQSRERMGRQAVRAIRPCKGSPPTSASTRARRSISRSTRPRGLPARHLSPRLLRRERRAQGGRRWAVSRPGSAELPDRSEHRADRLRQLGGVGDHGRCPRDAVSGIYFAKLVAYRYRRRQPHRLRRARRCASADVLFQTSDTTWQAYNQYGGNSLYVGGPATNPGRAYKVSYNRPFTTRGTAPEDWVFNAEYPMVRWLEANGYNVSYYHRRRHRSQRRRRAASSTRCFLSVGHDEYWSAHAARQRRSGARRRRATWRSSAATKCSGRRAGRTASTAPARRIAPWSATRKPTPTRRSIRWSSVWTGTWRDPRFSPPADGGRPENALTGTLFTRQLRARLRGDSACPQPMASMRVLAQHPRRRRCRPAAARRSPPARSATNGTRTSTTASARPA